jgi:hypothetical protein
VQKNQGKTPAQRQQSNTIKASNNNTANNAPQQQQHIPSCFQREPLALLRGPLYYSVS